MTDATPAALPIPVALPVPVPVPVPIPVQTFVIHKVADEEPIKKHQYIYIAPLTPAMPSVVKLYAKEEQTRVDEAILAHGDDKITKALADLNEPTGGPDPFWVGVVDCIVGACYLIARNATAVARWIVSLPGRTARAITGAGKSIASFTSSIADRHADNHDYGFNKTPRIPVQKSLAHAGFNDKPNPPVGASGTSAGSLARKELHSAIKRENLVISGFKVSSIKVSLDPYTKGHHVVIIADATDKSIVHISDPNLENMIVDLYQEG